MAKTRVATTVSFERRLKRFSKKFPTLEGEVDQLADQLLDNPAMGTSLGAGLFKVRLASQSKGGGKSGGFRVITYLVTETDAGTTIYLLILYDKSEEADIDKRKLLKLVDEYVPN